MITYNEIYEAARKERYSEQLQKLAKSFVSDFSKYLAEKRAITSQDENVFSDSVMKTKKQLENALTLFRELMIRRRKKILNLVLVAAETGISRQDFDNMLEFEKNLFEELMKCIDVSEKELSKMLNGNSDYKDDKNQLVVFLENVDEFVDMEGNKMGPFNQGDMANIPKEIAKILIDDGKAEIIEK